MGLGVSGKLGDLWLKWQRGGVSRLMRGGLTHPALGEAQCDDVKAWASIELPPPDTDDDIGGVIEMLSPLTLLLSLLSLYDKLSVLLRLQVLMLPRDIANGCSSSSTSLSVRSINSISLLSAAFCGESAKTHHNIAYQPHFQICLPFKMS